MNTPASISNRMRGESILLQGLRYAVGPEESAHGSIEISGGRIGHILNGAVCRRAAGSTRRQIDLTGYFVLPGLINAHDHLEFAIHPRLGDPPYLNYVEWGEDIHDKFPDVIARYRAVPIGLRLRWGGIRNLLCGVTTVCHHDPLWPELQRSDFPVRVVSEYGWAHSLSTGGDLRRARAATPPARAFIVHACEGVDERSRGEVWELDRLGVLDPATVLVHGLALEPEGVELVKQRRASLIVCPSSNQFLFLKLPDIPLLREIRLLALGSDSPLTAAGDLLDEIRFCISSCGIMPRDVYRMVTTDAARVLKLDHVEGSIDQSGVGDVIAVRDTGLEAAEILPSLAISDVELVMIGGRVQLISDGLRDRLPASMLHGLEPMAVGGMLRWLRAPVEEMVRRTKAALDGDQVRLGGRAIEVPVSIEAEHVL